MPLVIPRGTGDGVGFIRFKPTENAWFMSGPDGIEEFEWTSDVLIDIEQVELGWLLLATGMRDWLPWEDKNTKEEKPEGDYKFGISVKFFSKKIFGEDDPIRELCTNTNGVVQFVEKLYADAETSFSKGVPIVEFDGSTAMKIGKGATRVPQFTIKKFVKRPKELVNGLDTEAPKKQETAESVDDDDEF